MRLVLAGDEKDMYSWVWIHPMFLKQLFAPSEPPPFTVSCGIIGVAEVALFLFLHKKELPPMVRRRLFP